MFPTSASRRLNLNSTPVTGIATDHSLAATVAAGIATIAAGKHHLVHTYATGGTGTSADPWTGWNTACPWANNSAYVMTAGHYSLGTTTWNLNEFRGLYLVGTGESTVVHYSGTGTILTASCRDEGSVVVEHMPFFCYIGEMLLDGGGTAAIGLDIRGMIRSKIGTMRYRNIAATGTCLRLRWAVAVSFGPQCFVGSNIDSLSTVVPAVGIDMAATSLGAMPLENTVCTFDCVNMNGAGLGLRMMSGFGNVFNGGAFEGGAQSLYMGADVKATTFNGVDFEASAVPCFVDGYQNFFRACQSSGSQIVFGPNSYRNTIDGGYWYGLRDEGRANVYDPHLVGNGHTDANTTAATSLPIRLGANTVGATGSDFSYPGGTTLWLPDNSICRVVGSVTAYCSRSTAGNVGKMWVKRFDKVFACIAGIPSQISDAAPTSDAAPVAGWACGIDVYGSPAARSITAGVVGAAGDTIHWELAVEAQFNGGIGVAPTPTQRLTNIATDRGGFVWLATRATVAGSVMTVPPAAGAANLVAPSIARSPAIGTLADATTTAIVCAGSTDVLIPSGTLGTSTSHTWVFVGEPDQTNVTQTLFQGGSGGGAPTVAALSCNSAGNLICYEGVVGGPTAAKASGLQVIMIVMDATNGTRKIYRGRNELGSASYTGTALGAYAQIGVLGVFDISGFGANGAWTEILYLPVALTDNERYLLHKALKTTHPAIA